MCIRELGTIDQNMNEIEIKDAFFSYWLTADEVLIHKYKHRSVKQVKTLSMPLN